MTATPLDPGRIDRNRSLKPFTTLRAGGPAERFVRAATADEFAEMTAWAHRSGMPLTVLGWGSNVLPSDRGVPGIVVLNEARAIEIGEEGVVTADCGCGFQELFLKCAQARLGGLEFAVGIPGTLGGALVSNAGAYRSNVSEFLEAIEVVVDGARQWVEPAFMRFAYRDSILRRATPPPVALVRARLRLPSRPPKAIYDEAREYQRQRILKQPSPASAGSFFKNVYDERLADGLPGLPASLREAGVVPAGYLIQHTGLVGYRHGGAMIARRHANFIVNVQSATATEIRELAQIARRLVQDRFGVSIEEEVLYLGDWSAFE
ncbi:MAG: UDP-N-acetylmuramate dehydrogenase [Fimbriimonadaceae bacterium]|nr:UDP-N-acetylmuramate dehydrogenase [Fimbriimonadaceae bacterium]QYK55307.1 MAG: UDP-N-acetylmuramate dehydrogenase [Fimbriimonadaceae bacterium]